MHPNTPERGPGQKWATPLDLKETEGYSIYYSVTVRTAFPETTSYSTESSDTLPTPEAPIDYTDTFMDLPSKNQDMRAFELNQHFKGRWYLAIRKATVGEPLFELLSGNNDHPD